ncbi:MAG: hypothetical protein VX320_04475, partial [Candidatus Thermoplasmatota archaeon]|nr:hypothetical protein [Candidatus Thermoplasmatota archaeon]
MRKALVLVFLLLAGTLPLFANAEDPSLVRQRSAETEFTWTGTANTVQVSGEWDNWQEWTNLSEVNGVWTASLPLNSGMYCYKLIVDDNWIFDPSEPYR